MSLGKRPDCDASRRIRLIAALEAMRAAGVRDEQVALDPGPDFDLSVDDDERYQFFQQVGPIDDSKAEGFGPLVVDFKQMFSLPTQFLYDQIDSGQTSRRCRLQSPYLEHFSSRCAYYLSRVGLPRDHEYQENLPTWKF